MSSSTYDLVVVGSGPAGQKGAIAAAKAGDTLDCRWEPDTDIAHWLAKSLA